MPMSDETETDAALRALISARILAERERLGLSREHVARALGIARQTYRRYETGVAPGTIRLIELRDRCGYDLEAILAPLPEEQWTS